MNLLKKALIILSIISVTLIIANELPNTLKSKYYLLTNSMQNKEKKPDFSTIKNVKEKKSLFIRYTLEGIRNANKEICSEKKQLENIQRKVNENKKLTDEEKQSLITFAKFYKIDYINASYEDMLNKLFLRIGIAPKSFVLAQAILESGWGTSRFARNYNNYFGLHCFKTNCGPKAKGADVYLEEFLNISDSVLGYYYRLNTGGAFKKFRETREKYKDTPHELNMLLGTLNNYSELGGAEYKKRLLNVINHNNLRKYDNLTC